MKSSRSVQGQRCECCGLLTLSSAELGSYEVCPVCFWENDPVQNGDPSYAGGANAVSLRQARQNWTALGASQPEYLRYVRAPQAADIPWFRTHIGLDADCQQSRQWGVKAHLLAVVRGMLAGSVGITEGSRLLASGEHQLEPHWRAELSIFAGVARETDDLPLGAVRQLWHPDALARKDRERFTYEDNLRERVLQACGTVGRLLADELGCTNPDSPW